MSYSSQSVAIVAHQLSLCPPLPTVLGPVEFTEFCARWERVDALVRAGVEREFVTRSLAHKTRARPMTPAEQAAYQRESQRALRCTVARLLLGESLREFSCHLAESAVLQRFCLLGDLATVTIPGHSQLQRYQYWLPAEEMATLITGLLQQAQGAEGPTPLGLAEPVDLSTVWVDSTCAETPVHHPVDWLLLRDAVRTLILAIVVLREHGLKQRMPEPGTFLTAMNQLCIAMTHGGKGAKGTAKRKAVLRAMTALVHTVQGHAERYVALVAALPAPPPGWAGAAQRRMQAVLEQLPAVLHQAHERIIGERPVSNAEKVLSLYEPDTAVLLRGKQGAQVEFGYSLFLAEQRDGLIVDWALPQTPQTDGALLQEAIRRWQTAYGETLRTVVTDRGFDGRATRTALAEAGLRNGMCPRSPRQLIERLEEPTFRAQQRRRAQTEGRIAIVKQTFLGGRLHTKGYAHHVQEVAWTILAHNLWVLARLPVTSKQALAA